MKDMQLLSEANIPDTSKMADQNEISEKQDSEVSDSNEQPVTTSAEVEKSATPISADFIEQLKNQIVGEVTDNIRKELTQEIVVDIINSLSGKFLNDNGSASILKTKDTETKEEIKVKPKEPTSAERFNQVSKFNIIKESCENPIWRVKLGATKEEGGTRSKTYTIGGETCMPFHLWEGEMPNRPLIAMEVFDLVSEKYPPILKEIYKDTLEQPAEMARACVEKHGADLISVRLEGTHPEKGNRTADEAVEVVKAVLEKVNVPLIITGHSHFEKNNEVMKSVAQAFAGENLLLNWVEQDNYRTIAGAAMAYGHSIVSQSPIDVNIAKQMNILLTNMDIKPERIVMDPMTGAAGYGIEYTYSVMERTRLTALNGDKMLAGPMIVTPGQECVKIKEFKATESEFPVWGDLAKRAAMWELSTAVNLLYSGADILIMYHPEAVAGVSRTIKKLMGVS